MATSTSPTNTGKINFNISAPGKIILHGEHSVVYNKLALAASLDLRTHANLTEINNTTNEQQIQINFTNLNCNNCNFPINNIMQLLLTTPIPVLEQYRIEDYDYTKPEILDHLKLLEIIKEFVKNHQKLIDNDNDKIEISLLSLFYLIYGIFVGFNMKMRPFSLTISTDLSIGAGTGSSASYLVTLSATFINYIKLKQPPPKYNNHKLSGGGKFNDFELDLISRWAYCAEKIIHGTPSGIDNTICTYGSMIEFRKNTNIDIVKFKKQLPLLLINTKIQRNTRLLVEKVADSYKNHSNTVGKIFEAMDELAQEAAIYLKQINNNDDDDDDDCYNKLMELSSINHNLLRSLNVSHPKLDAICQILQEYHLDGKLTGAGGGGYAICLIPPKFNQQPQQIQQIIDKLQLIDCDTIYTNLGGEGVKID